MRFMIAPEFTINGVATVDVRKSLRIALLVTRIRMVIDMFRGLYCYDQLMNFS
jgi:hypothetical protein